MTDTTLAAGLRTLPPADRALLKVLVASALAALALGILFGALTALARARFVAFDPEAGYRLMTLHGAMVFFYWLYFAQAAMLLAFAAVHTGAPGIAMRPAAWAGCALMLAGLAANQAGTWRGAPLLYDASPEVVVDTGPAAVFYLGYLSLSLGLCLLATSALVTALRGKASTGGVWSAVAFGTVAWAGLVLVSAVAGAIVFLPPALWTLGLAAEPEDYASHWHLLFHNMHYLPLMGTVLIWYALIKELTGVASLLGDRFSKATFALYLVFVPPTSLYHMFLEPDLAPALRVIGSLLSLFIGVPTVAVFLVIVASLEAHARAAGARGLFGWIRSLPWREPAMAAVGMAVVNLALGGALAFVLIQEQLAPLLSDTFVVPGYFHFLTVGTVTLTLLAALARLIPALTGGALWAPRVLAALPAILTVSLLLFGVAGIAAGVTGMPRRVLDAAYDGAAPHAWSVLSGLIGIGGAAMAAALGIYIYGLLRSFAQAPARGERSLPAHAAPSRAVAAQAAWTGPISVVVLIAAMYGATAFAFMLMRGLPITAAGGGTH